MPRLDKVKESKNFENRTGRYNRFIDEQFYKLLMRTGLTYPSDPEYIDHVDDVRSAPPEIKGVGPNPLAAESRTQHWSDMELTPEEAALIDKGAKPRDILLMRAYKRMPGLVGK